MSLTKFSAAMQEHLKSGNQSAVVKQFEELLTSFRNSYKKDLAEGEKSFKDWASVLETDIPTNNSQYPYNTEFRLRGMRERNNKFVVTENTLREMFKRYGLTKPSDYASLIEFFNDWLQNYSSKFGTKKIEDGREKNFGKQATARRQAAFQQQVEDFRHDSTDTPGDLYAVRISNIAHTATADLLYEFLKYRSTTPRKKGNLPPKEQFSKDYQIGHIESQSYGKLRISSGIIPDKTLTGGRAEDLIEYLISLNQYLDLASSSMLPDYDKLIAAITKDFDGEHVYMNVEMQPAGQSGSKTKKNILTNQGSSVLGKALALTKLLTTAVATRSGVQTTIDDSINIEKIAGNMEQLLVNYIKNKQYVQHTLKNFKGMPPNFLLNLESSDSIRTHIKNITIAILDPSKSQKKKVKAKHNNVPVKTLDNTKSKQLKDKIAADTKALTQKLKTLSSAIKSKKAKANNKRTSSASSSGILESGPPAQLRTTTGQFYGLTPLQALLDGSLVQRVKENMGTGNRRDILNLRTGRFAESVKVERLSQSREGMITAFYTYMRNPYATFSEGGRQELPRSRDPKLLIAKSIREIGATMVANRMRAVLV